VNEEERFDPRRHSLDYAAERLKILSENTYRLHKEIDSQDEQMLLGESEQDTGEHPAVDRYIPSKAEIRAFIREEVHRALYPVAEMANPHEHMRVEMVTEQGKRWRGVLYGVEKESE
jgi:hypothetical protein